MALPSPHSLPRLIIDSFFNYIELIEITVLCYSNKFISQHNSIKLFRRIVSNLALLSLSFLSIYPLNMIDLLLKSPCSSSSLFTMYLFLELAIVLFLIPSILYSTFTPLPLFYQCRLINLL